MKKILIIGLILICLVYIWFVVGYFVMGYNLVGVILILVPIIIWLIWKFIKWRKFNREIEEEIERRERLKEEEHQRRERLRSEIDKYLRDALGIMDSVDKWYRDEDEANKELVLYLKSLGVDANYRHRLPNGRTADAIVGDILIEGKVSPNTEGVDRLLGQLCDYTQYGNQVNIVIYGRLEEGARRRVENEIHLRYTGKVFLTYLDNPKRQRAPSVI